jgi:hypothetical protein
MNCVVNTYKRHYCRRNERSLRLCSRTDGGATMMIGWRMSSSYLMSRYGRVSASVSDLGSRSGLDPDSIRSVDPYPDQDIKFWSSQPWIRTPDPDWIRISIQPKMLHPNQMNTDPEHWFHLKDTIVDD